jgi:hypothetical protein
MNTFPGGNSPHGMVLDAELILLSRGRVWVLLMQQQPRGNLCTSIDPSAGTTAGGEASVLHLTCNRIEDNIYVFEAV